MMRTILFTVILLACVLVIALVPSWGAEPTKRYCQFPGCKTEIKDNSFTCGWVRRGAEIRVCLKHGYDQMIRDEQERAQQYFKKK